MKMKMKDIRKARRRLVGPFPIYKLDREAKYATEALKKEAEASRLRDLRRANREEL